MKTPTKADEGVKTSVKTTTKAEALSSASRLSEVQRNAWRDLTLRRKTPVGVFFAPVGVSHQQAKSIIRALRPVRQVVVANK